MPTTLFSAAGGVYRGNLHGHSTHSDGLKSSADAAALYRGRGYDFTCLSDHLWIDTRYAATTVNDTRALDSESFITIASAEIHCPGKAHDRGGLWHIVATGLPLDFRCADKSETGPQLVRRAVDAGAFVAIAHPEWHSLTSDEAMSLARAGAHGVEIYNHSCMVKAARGSGVATLDHLLNEGVRIHATAGDDSHIFDNDAFGGWVMVAAPELNAAGIVDALKRGDYYSSSGPDIIAIRHDKDSIEVESSPVSRIILAADRNVARARAGQGITRAVFDIKELNLRFLRIVLQDDRGAQAWSNVFWTEDLKQVARER